ncbi:MAG: urease accessory protein UreE [Opitutaceae bacterium]|nr:urease accessory protein UreE [Opitutaceae bacterium]
MHLKTSALHLIHAPLVPPKPGLREIAVAVDRHTLAKRRWRGAAEDGTEFGFELEAPLKHGDAFFQTNSACYVIAQHAEPVVEISLAITPAAAAGIGWAVGNLHLELQAEPTRLLAPDEPAVRQLLDRLQVPYAATNAIFRPGRFARGLQPTHELGPSHKH